MQNSPAFIRVLAAGAALSLAGCDPVREEPTRNPPAPEVEPPPLQPVPDVPLIGNPPAPQSGLPSWDAVGSNHPEGATNPPSPVLVVTKDGAHCYKQWRGGMLPPEPDVEEFGGKVIDNADPAAGTEIVCPPQAAAVLEAYRNRGSGPK